MQVPVKNFLKKFLNLSQNAKRVRQSVYRTPLDGLLESVGMAPLRLDTVMPQHKRILRFFQPAYGSVLRFAGLLMILCQIQSR